MSLYPRAFVRRCRDRWHAHLLMSPADPPTDDNLVAHGKELEPFLENVDVLHVMVEAARETAAEENEPPC